VVSWDLIPRAAIARIELIGGSDPLFGLNSLGGALSIHTKDGFSSPGTQLHAAYGSNDRRQIEAETGGHDASGFHWYATANRFEDDGWRDASPGDAKQAFGKFGWRGEATEASLTASGAWTDLSGNGLQEARFLARDYASVYTKPDETWNRAGLLNLQVSHDAGDGLALTANAWYRTIRTTTLNGDINEEALGENPYQPGAAERSALAAAGYTGFPSAGEAPSNTPFPRWRCIANVLLNSEPNEKCNGLENRTALTQHVVGTAAQLSIDRDVGGHGNRFLAGVWLDDSAQHFTQGSQFAYLTADRSVVGVAGPGAFADGSQDSESAFDARVDLTGGTRTQSAYVADSLAITPALRANVAARYDRSQTTTTDAITPGGGTGSLNGRHTFDRLNPSLGFVLEATPEAAIFGSYSESSRAPSAIELGCADPESPCRLPNAMAGDPPLEQVVTKSFEAGIRGIAGAASSWSLSGFRGDSDDDILFVADEQAGFGYFRNFGRTRRQGIELAADTRRGDWSFALHYTYLDATYRSAETLNGEGNSSNQGPAPGFEGEIDIAPGDRLPLIPRNILKLAAQWQATPRLSVRTDLAYVGGANVRGNENGEHRPDGTHYLASGAYGGRAVWNLGAEWTPAETLTLYLQVDNLLDRRYSTSGQLGAAPFLPTGEFISRPFDAPLIGGERPLQYSTFFAPGAPRIYLVGVRYRLGFGRKNASSPSAGRNAQSE
jgi:outer membrane receptor protein involved in Fe transport